MFKSLWNYLRGYVVLTAEGFSVERFINMAAFKNVDLREITRDGGVLTATANVAGFRALVPIARKTKCKLRVKAKRGLPFVLYRYRKRKALFAGALLCAAVIFFMSSFVWLVQTEGAVSIDAGTVTEFLKTRGLHSGAFKRSVDERALENALLAEFPKILWVNVDIKGTRALVKLTEVKPAPVIEDASAPTDITAATDGLIISITTSAGTPLVKTGDVVRQGDVLVSGALTTGDEETGLKTRYVRAQAKIRAEIKFETTTDTPLIYLERAYTGGVKKERTLIMFDKTVPLGLKPKINYKSYEVTTTKKTAGIGGDYPLPFTYVRAEYREFIMAVKTRSVEQAEYIGRENALAVISAELDKDAEIIAQEVSYERIEDFVRTYLIVTVIERIDKETKIAR